MCEISTTLNYGRLCPVETPEGPNIGLISYLSAYARVNRFGFIEAPYRKVDKESGRVTDEIHYMTADVEDEFTIAQATEPMDEENCFVNERITCRHRNEIVSVAASQVDYVDVSPDDVLRGYRHDPLPPERRRQPRPDGRQRGVRPVPLLTTQAPIVATGQEHKNCVDSEVAILAEEGREVVKVSAQYVSVRYQNLGLKEYDFIKFLRSNHGTCINQRPIVSAGQKVSKGEVIVDGPSTCNGEIGLGKNILMGFMTWEGYNYEDAILLNERMVKEDVFTSIHIEEYETESRDTKLGPEEITPGHPQCGRGRPEGPGRARHHPRRPEVHSGDILVGKVTPKGETDLTAEERLLPGHLGEKAREVRDTSLKVPHGESGIIVDVKVFTREAGDEPLSRRQRGGPGLHRPEA